MLVDLNTARAGSPSPSLLNSPTLARVERARMKQEGGDTSSLVSNSTLLQNRIDSYCQVSHYHVVLHVIHLIILRLRMLVSAGRNILPLKSRFNLTAGKSCHSESRDRLGITKPKRQYFLSMGTSAKRLLGEVAKWAILGHWTALTS